MDIIKENTFFVVMGVIVLVALAAFFVLVQPMKSDNAAKLVQVEKLSRQLQRLMNEHDSGKPLPNDKTMALVGAYNKKYGEEADKVVDRMKRMDLLKDMKEVLPPFTSVDVDETDFKEEYADHVTALKGRLASKNIFTTSDTWAFWDWGIEMPRVRAQRELAAKEFVILAELVDILELSKLSVRVVDKLEVDPGISRSSGYVATKKRERMGDYFRVYPFVLSVRMDLAKRELLLEELLKSDLPIFIRTVGMERVLQDKSLYGRNMPPVYVGVKIEGWVLDYSEKPKEDLRPGMPGMAGRGSRRY